MAWERWRSGLPQLEHIEVDRCFKPRGFGEITSASLHHFSDASCNGYGQCSYLRLVDDDGDNIHCMLVIGKSRVPPTKPVTIPRLELSAAAVSAKIGHCCDQSSNIIDLLKPTGQTAKSFWATFRMMRKDFRFTWLIAFN